MKKPNRYSDNVFINCPFDHQYTPLFRAIIFAVADCGFVPRCALEEDNAGVIRMEKIVRIINECKYGIHDLSKADADKQTGLARFNMPFELGLFIGAQRYATVRHYNREKCALIFDLEPYRYQSFISDISGQDIKAHNGKPETVIKNVRDFLHANTKRVSIASGTFIVSRYKTFLKELPDYCKRTRRDVQELNFIDFCMLTALWITENPN